MPTVRESTTAVVVRGETISDGFVSEPYEAGWAIEAVIFVLGMDDARGGTLETQISPDGLNWIADGGEIEIPGNGQVGFARVGHFGNWLRVLAKIPGGGTRRVHVTMHLKG